MTDETFSNIGKSLGLIFLLERRLENLLDKVLAPRNLTTKQWLVLAVIEKSKEDNLSIQDIATRLFTSHQNIKAIALNLEKRGFISLFKDERDKRVTRVAITQMCKSFWTERESEDRELLVELFEKLSEEELSAFPKTLTKLIKTADQITEKLITSENSQA